MVRYKTITKDSTNLNSNCRISLQGSTTFDKSKETNGLPDVRKNNGGEQIYLFFTTQSYLSDKAI